MKKQLVLLSSALAAALFLTGCSSDGSHFEEKSYRSDGAQISGVHVDVRDREVEVSLSDDAQIHIDYFESDKEYFDISVSDEGLLTMTAQSEKEWTDYIGGNASAGANKISLQVPADFLSTLSISTTKRDISLPALTVTNDLSLSANGGNITFDQLNVGNVLTLENKNGNISGTIIGSYEDYAISCKIKKGESNLPTAKEGGDKTLNVTNNNGDIEIAFVSK